jgi:hypothetical protein
LGEELRTLDADLTDETIRLAEYGRTTVGEHVVDGLAELARENSREPGAQDHRQSD